MINVTEFSGMNLHITPFHHVTLSLKFKLSTRKYTYAVALINILCMVMDCQF